MLGEPACTIELACSGGSPLALRRIVQSHGLAGVEPWQRTASGGMSIAVERDGRGALLSVEAAVGCDPDSAGGSVEVSLSGAGTDAAVALARRMLGLERDLTGFHRSAAADDDLDWVPAAGAGAMARGATVFEDVIRTILTTNCAWSSTVSMCAKLAVVCGEPVAGRHAFPTAAAVAAIDEQTLREEVRAGYRTTSLIEVARRQVTGPVDLEELGTAARDEISDDEVERRLLELPGVGPYAAAHVMLLLGRPSRPVLDSWTRPKYARMIGRKRVSDAEILKRVGRHAPDAGLALWLILTRDWFDGSGTLDA